MINHVFIQLLDCKSTKMRKTRGKKSRKKQFSLKKQKIDWFFCGLITGFDQTHLGPQTPPITWWPCTSVGLTATRCADFVGLLSHCGTPRICKTLAQSHSGVQECVSDDSNVRPRPKVVFSNESVAKSTFKSVPAPQNSFLCAQCRPDANFWWNWHFTQILRVPQMS
jgi:hypothetical protein